MRKISLIIILTFVFNIVQGQSILSKNISVNIAGLSVEKALQLISSKGNFHFSYNSSIIPKNKTVSYVANNKTIKQVLDVILEEKYEYIEANNYIILKLLPAKLVIVTKQAVLEDRFYYINGYVLDQQSNEPLHDASIYEKTQLALATSTTNGAFKIKLKSKYKKAGLTISKELYDDTTVEVSPRYNQQLTVSLTPAFRTFEVTIISPQDYALDAAFPKTSIDSNLTLSRKLFTDTTKVEKTRVANFILSTSQKIRSLNLKNFFTSRPYQVSLTPGLSTQGKLSAQVSNNFSLNILGGYTGGVNGVEVAGLFNINKRQVRYAQLAGLFNITGGKVTGVQIGGLNNTVLDSVNGVQVAGISNIVSGSYAGAQIAGIYNHASSTVSGLQVAGISNFSKERVTGMQVSGIGNIAYRNMNGVQVGGIFNYAKRLRGVQLGLINIADTSEGYSIGLLNIVFKGYHKLVFTSNEYINVNAGFKTGNKKLYSILMAGYNYGTEEKAYAIGYGIGTEQSLSKYFSVNPELSSQYVYLGSIFDLNFLHKLNLDLHINLGKHFSIYGGPSFNSFYSDQRIAVPGFKSNIPNENYKSFKVTSSSRGWIGWNVGVSFF